MRIMKPIVKIKRLNNFEYSFVSSNESGIKVVAKSLTFENPDPFAYSDEIKMFDKIDLTFGIGMLKVVKSHCKENNIEFDVKDYSYEIPDIKGDSRLSGKYEFQVDAVRRFYQKRFGIIKVPTRGGKTFLTAEIARYFLLSEQGNFLFVTDNTTLFTQACNDIKTFFEPHGGIEVSQIKSGLIDTSKRITVGMIQTIQSTFSKRCKDKQKKRLLTKYMNELKFLCIDEIHDNSSDSRMKIYKKCKNLEFQLCLSATPYKDDSLKKNLKLQSWSGGVIYDIKESKLREIGVLSSYKVFMIFIDHTENHIPEEGYADLRKTLLIYNTERNELIIRVLKVMNRLQLKTLVLFQDIAHGDEISLKTGIPFISGVTKGDVREEEKLKFLSGKGGCLLASGIFKKGVTLPQVEVMVNVGGGLESSNTIQKKGRVLGVTDDKKRSLIIDFFDHDNTYFSEHSDTRLNTYINAIGDDNVGVLDSSSLDCFKVLREWTETWLGKGKNSLGMP